MKEKKDRVDDALHATRAAVEEGIVPGGGVALLRTRKAIKAAIDSAEGDEKVGMQIVYNVAEAPLRQIVENAGRQEAALVVAKVEAAKGSQGYDARNDEYVDLLAAGIVDPAKVTRLALQNAASVAGLLLTTECMITDLPEKKECNCGHGGRRRHGRRHDVAAPAFPERRKGRDLPGRGPFLCAAGPPHRCRKRARRRRTNRLRRAGEARRAARSGSCRGPRSASR